MRDINALYPPLQEKVHKLVDLCKENGIIIAIGECLRTKAEQDALYAQGRTKPGSIVTNCKGSTYSSMHQWGVAFDFYLKMDVDGDGQVSDDAFNNATRLFNKVGELGKSIGLEWGGNWKSPVDMPHFQLPDWGSTAAKLKSLYGKPENFMNHWCKKEEPKGEDHSSVKPNMIAGEGVVTPKSGVKIRKGAGTSSETITAAPYNATCKILSLNECLSNGYTWAKVEYNGVTGYAAQKYLKITKMPVSEETTSPMLPSTTNADGNSTDVYSKTSVKPAKAKDANYAGAYVTSANLNLRAGSGTGENIITTIPKGSLVRCYGYYNNEGKNNVWLLVAYGKYTGYVSKKYLRKE